MQRKPQGLYVPNIRGTMEATWLRAEAPLREETERKQADQALRAEQRREHKRQEQIATRRENRKTEPCSMRNAEEELAEDDPVRAVEPLSRQRLHECIQQRAAPCQALVDANDLAAAGSCWSQQVWSDERADRVDGDGSYDPADVEQCLTSASAWRGRFLACERLPDDTDERIVAKADCLLNKASRPWWRYDGLVYKVALGSGTDRPPVRCGHLDLAAFAARTEAAVDVAKIATRAESARERLHARDSACESYDGIVTMKRQLAEEVKLKKRMPMLDRGDAVRGWREHLATFQGVHRASTARFKRLWKRPWSRARDCKKRP